LEITNGLKFQDEKISLFKIGKEATREERYFEAVVLSLG